MKKLFLMMILVMSVGHSQRIVACEYEKQIINNKKINTKELIEKKSSSVSKDKNSNFNLKKVEIFVDIDLDVKNLYYRDPNNFKLWKAHIKDAAHKPCFINCTYSSPDWRTNRDGALEFIEKNKLKNEKICVDGMREVKDDTESNKIISDWLFVHFDASFNEITKQFEDLKTDFTSIPLPLLVDPSNNFKKKGDIVFAFTQKIDGSDVEFEIKLATDTSDKNFTQLIETFGNNIPNILENEQSNLAKAGIITVTDCWSNGCQVIKIGHGPKSLWGIMLNQQQERALAAQDEKKQKEKELQEKMAQAGRIYFMRRCCVAGLSFAAIIGFLYYKFSTTNQKLI